MEDMKQAVWVDPGRDLVKTRREFLDDLARVEYVPKYIRYENPYKQLLTVTAALLEGVDTTLVDPTFEGQWYIDENSNDDVEANIELEGWLAFVQAVREAMEKDWKLGLFTSGSTGPPKHVWQPVATLTSSVRTDPRFKKHRWGFCYESTHMAGLQVFFQAIANGNLMAYLFESEANTIASTIQRYKLTHFSATPTFYRLRMLKLDDKFSSARRMTSGGEPFDRQTMSQLRNIFPDSKVRNIYALTETGPLFESASEYFEIPDELTEHVKVSEDSELLLDESLVEDADPEDIDTEGWFHTGDIIEEGENGKIKVVGRNDEKVTVGGRQVNLRNIEHAILKSDYRVVESMVKPRESSVMGNILVADIVVSDAKKKKVIKSIRKKLSSKMPKYKIPRKFNVKEEIETTRSGKRKRN